MLVLYPNDFTEALIPIIHGSHQHWNKTSPPGWFLLHMHLVSEEVKYTRI